MRASTRGGISIPELLIGFSVFSFLMVVLATALNQGTFIWNRSVSSNTSQNEMRKAHAALDRDLQATVFEEVRTTSGPTTLGGLDGDAIWFLSSYDPVTDEFLRNDEGEALWQRNILYYTVVPDSHYNLHKVTCAGGPGADGYEALCPHKLLIRKVIDNPPATGPSDEPEELLADVSSYLTRPDGYRVSPMLAGEDGVEDVTIKANNLVSLRATLAPDPTFPGEVRIELRGASIPENQRTFNVGSDSLEQFIRIFTFSVFPLASPEDPSP